MKISSSADYDSIESFFDNERERELDRYIAELKEDEEEEE